MNNRFTFAQQLQKYRLKIGRFLRRLPQQRWHPSRPHPGLASAIGTSVPASSDMRDHLSTLFYEAVSAKPHLMVELGTRGGISLRALLAAAEVADAHVLSLDISNCSGLDLPAHLAKRWTFIQADDVEFAGQPFAEFCNLRGLPIQAEVILVDTSHTLPHTRAEIMHWLPRLAPQGVMMFHDTHMGGGWLRRLDGKVERGWNNDRGVIRAIEERLGRRYDETTVFADCTSGFAIYHVPWSSGFTVLRKL
jgi:hypothetical protein